MELLNELPEGVSLDSLQLTLLGPTEVACEVMVPADYDVSTMIVSLSCTGSAAFRPSSNMLIIQGKPIPGKTALKVVKADLLESVHGAGKQARRPRA